MMTREEATEILRKRQRYCKVIADHANATVKADELREIEAIDIALSALRPISREQVEKVWRGEWKHYLPPLGAGDVQCRCTRCGRTPDVETPFCAWCGAPMTDEAVQMVMERMEALYETAE